MKEQLAAARKLRLDADRVEGAKRRAAAALEVADHHQKLADNERARASLLARTWGFVIDAGRVLDKD